MSVHLTWSSRIYRFLHGKNIYAIYIDVKRLLAIRDRNRVTLAQISAMKKGDLTIYHCDCLSEQRGLNRVD